jgi:hypothetical protein
MSMIALLVEGQAEEIYIQYLLPSLESGDRLFFSKDILKIINDDKHENKIWLVNCGGDGSLVSYINKNIGVFMRNDFKCLILIRDYHPETYNVPFSQNILAKF